MNDRLLQRDRHATPREPSVFKLFWKACRDVAGEAGLVAGLLAIILLLGALGLWELLALSRR